MTTPFNPLSACPSPSALRVASARAVHQLLDEPRVLDDSFALAVLGPASASALLSDPYAHNSVPARSMRAGIVARSRFAEDRLLSAVQAGTRQYAVVGAGLDTWALRNASVLPAVDVYEMDQSGMQGWKQQAFASNGWERPSRLHWVTADLRQISIIDALSGAGANLAEPIAVSILGVLVYLEQRDMELTLQSLGRLAAGSTLVLDYRLGEEHLPPMERMMMGATAQMMAAGGEPWRSSADPGLMRELLAGAGFRIEEDVDTADLNARYYARRRDGLQIAGGGFRYLSAVMVQ